MQKFPIKETHDTLIVYRDTIIEVPVFSVDDTTFAWGTVFDTVYASSGTAHARTYIVRDTIRLTVWQSDTTLKVRLDSALMEITIRDNQIYTVKQECKKGKVERVIDSLIILFAILCGTALIIALIKMFK
jgi:hypothetical protein